MNKINLFLILLFASADFLTKKLVLSDVLTAEVLIENPGLPFIGETVSGFFNIALIFLLLVVFVYLYTLWNDPRYVDLGFSLIVGGATANLFDRVADSAVTDFIPILGGVFNLADIFIWAGIILLGYNLIMVNYKPQASDNY